LTQPSPIKKALVETKIPILQPARIKDPQSIEEIRALLPDVIVVMAYGQILSRTILQIPALACLNLHASLLPRHRGAAPIQAAITSGDLKQESLLAWMRARQTRYFIKRKIDSRTDRGSLQTGWRKSRRGCRGFAWQANAPRPAG
jgi:hypothetical protein